MNHLNSILLEGLLIEEPNKELKDIATFKIRNDRQRRDENGNKVTSSIEMKCIAYTELADRLIDHYNRGIIKIGTPTRVLGILSMHDDKFEIKCQHVEYRTRYKEYSESGEVDE